MDAVTDEFLTASADGTVRLWDLRTPACNGVIRCGTTPCVASDLQGLIFAAATDDGELKLYDARKYGQGPFIDFQVGSVDPGTGKRPRVTCAKFSPDGEGVLCVAGGTMYIIDAFKGDELMRINVGAETGTFISILVWAIRLTSCFVCLFHRGHGPRQGRGGRDGEQPRGVLDPGQQVPAVGRRGLAGTRVERGQRGQGCDVGREARGDPVVGAVGSGDDARRVGVHGGGMRAVDSHGGRGTRRVMLLIRVVTDQGRYSTD